MQYLLLLIRNQNLSIFFQSLLLFTGLFLLQSCGGDDFSEEEPFAVMAHRYRYPQEAIQAKERLEAMDLSPYLIAYEPVGEGPWYGVFLGASESLEGMLKSKIALEDQYGLQRIERANYHQVNAVAFDFPSSTPPLITEDTPKAPMGEPANALLNAIPYMTNFQLKEIKLLCTEDISMSNLKDLRIDFPRGIVPKQLYQSMTGLVSIFYEDELIGKETHLIALQLQEEHPYGDDPAQRFAESILGTRRYEIENMSEINESFASGYTVSIVPTPGKTKHYLVLYEPKQRLVFFGESSSKEYSIGDWQQMAKQIGGASNSWKYYELQQMLQWAPDSIADPLVYFHGLRWEGKKSDGASLLYGNLKGEYTFYQPESKQTWEALLYRFASPKNARGYYQQVFKKAKLSQSITVDSLNIGLSEAVLYSQKRRIRWKKYEVTPNKIIGFDGTHHIGSFYFDKSGLSADAMEERVKRFGW